MIDVYPELVRDSTTKYEIEWKNEVQRTREINKR